MAVKCVSFYVENVARRKLTRQGEIIYRFNMNKKLHRAQRVYHYHLSASYFMEKNKAVTGQRPNHCLFNLFSAYSNFDLDVRRPEEEKVHTIIWMPGVVMLHGLDVSQVITIFRVFTCRYI